MKRLMKKLAMLLMTFTMMVGVGLGVSACSITISNDNKNQEQQTTTTQPTNPDKPTEPAEPTPPVADTNDQHVHTLQKALRDLAEYRGMLSFSLTEKGKALVGSAGEASGSFDPAQGIGYYKVTGDGDAVMVLKVFQDGGRYVEYGHEHYYDEDEKQIYDETTYALVDQNYVRELTYGNIGEIDYNSNPITSILIGTDLDSATFSAVLLSLIKSAVGTGDDTALIIDEDSYAVNYVAEDELLTVTITAQGTGTEVSYIDGCLVSADMTIVIDDGVFASADLHVKVTDTVNGQRVVTGETNASMSCTFDQAGFKRVKTGTLPANIQTKTCPVYVGYECVYANKEGNVDYVSGGWTTLAVPYKTTINADNIDDYNAQLGNAIGIDASKSQIFWTNEDRETPFDGSFTVNYTNRYDCELYAVVVVDNDLVGGPSVEIGSWVMPVDSNAATVLKAADFEMVQYNNTTKWYEFDLGYTIGAAAGTSVVACWDGKITSVIESGDPSTGKLVRIQHQDGLETVYSSLDTITVQVGDVVKRGEQIGTVGNTANYEIFEMPHVRLMVYQNGKVVDPATYIEFPENDNEELGTDPNESDHVPAVGDTYVSCRVIEIVDDTTEGSAQWIDAEIVIIDETQVAFSVDGNRMDLEYVIGDGKMTVMNFEGKNIGFMIHGKTMIGEMYRGVFVIFTLSE